METEVEVVDNADLMKLCGADHALFCSTFFPDAYSQKIPEFKHKVYSVLDDPSRPKVALKMFRGSGKTTDLRVYALKRIAYGLSRTIVFTSVSQKSAENSVDFIRSQIEHNKTFTSFYSLAQGSKWTDAHIRIEHKLLGHTINVVAVGITGQLRGINIEGKRPDLIIADDPQDEEWSGTPEQRKKFDDLFFGALAQSLTPSTENPTSKIAFLQTPLNREDAISKCVEDPSWTTFSFGILDEEHNESIWEDRFPTSSVLEERQTYAKRHQLSIWLREKMCKTISDETSYFSRSWLQFYDTLPRGLVSFIGIDPVPSPSDAQLAKGLRDKDYFAIFVLGVWSGNYYLLDIEAGRNPDPAWVNDTIFNCVRRWRPARVRVEGTNYQRELKNTLEAEQRKRKVYFAIDAVPSKGKKVTRIRQTYSNNVSLGQLYVPRQQSEHVRDFISQFEEYPDVLHDDLLDAGAIALEAATDYIIDEDVIQSPDDVDFPDLGDWRKAP